MESIKGQARERTCKAVSGVIERHKLTRNTLVNVTTDESQNLTGKKVGLLKRIHESVKMTS